MILSPSRRRRQIGVRWLGGAVVCDVREDGDPT